MRTTVHRVRRGFTLIELSIATMIGMSIGAMTLALCNQQLTFLKLYKAQNFLTDEAPVVSMYVSRLIGKADRFRLHDSVADALAGKNPRLTGSPVVVLNFRQPDGTVRASILSFEDRGTGSALYYYVVPVSGVLGTPQWAITKSPANVTFAMNQGILQMTLTGPRGEQITYSGTMQQ
jgi:prepilin-type N-terminal cleavage/methylation domain-containing protein